MNAAIFKARGSQSQPDESAGDESEGDESEGDDTEEVEEDDEEEEDGDDEEEEEEDGDDDEEEDETPPPPLPTKALERVKQVRKAAQLTSSKVQLRSQMVKQVADLKGKQRATPSATPKASNPLRSELQSSQIARRKRRDLLEMDEMEVNSQPQPPPSEERDAATRGGISC